MTCRGYKYALPFRDTQLSFGAHLSGTMAIRCGKTTSIITVLYLRPKRDFLSFSYSIVFLRPTNRFLQLLSINLPTFPFWTQVPISSYGPLTIHDLILFCPFWSTWGCSANGNVLLSTEAYCNQIMGALDFHETGYKISHFSPHTPNLLLTTNTAAEERLTGFLTGRTEAQRSIGPSSCRS